MYFKSFFATIPSFFSFALLKYKVCKITKNINTMPLLLIKLAMTKNGEHTQQEKKAGENVLLCVG
jgi:hypothetical protein